MLVPTSIPPHQAGKGCRGAPSPRCWLHVPTLVPIAASSQGAEPRESPVPPRLCQHGQGSACCQLDTQPSACPCCSRIRPTGRRGGCHPTGVGMGERDSCCTSRPGLAGPSVCTRVCMSACVCTRVCLQRCLLHPGLAAQAVCTGVSSCRVGACLPAQVPGLCPLPCPSPGWVCTAGGAPLWGPSPPANPSSCPIARPAALGATPRRGVTADQRWGL